MVIILVDQPVVTNPCSPSPCGSNAECRVQQNAGSCSCFPGYIGNPYEGCRPECVLNSDCSANLACISSKCRDPCPGTCGQNAVCQVVNHLPTCSCIDRYTGDPFRFCNFISPTGKLINPSAGNVLKERYLTSHLSRSRKQRQRLSTFTLRALQSVSRVKRAICLLLLAGIQWQPTRMST